MTKEEQAAFNKMMKNIGKHKNRKIIETGENEYTIMLPMANILAELRAFCNFIRAQQEQSTKQ